MLSEKNGKIATVAEASLSIKGMLENKLHTFPVKGSWKFELLDSLVTRRIWGAE